MTNAHDEHVEKMGDNLDMPLSTSCFTGDLPALGRVSGSVMDRIMACPSSALEPQIKEIRDTDVASDGRLAHLHLKDHVEGKDQRVFESDRIKFLVERGKGLWERIKEHFPHPQAELKIVSEALKLTTTPDVWDYVDGWINIADWKTGLIKENPFQMMTAGLLLMMELEKAGKEVKGVRSWTIFIPDWEIIPYEFSPDDLAKLGMDIDNIEDRARENEYQQNAYCSYCPRLAECPLLSRALTFGENTSFELTEQSFIKYQGMYEILKVAMKRYEDARKEYLADKEIVAPDNRKYKMIETKKKSFHYQKTVNEMQRLRPELDAMEFTEQTISSKLFEKAVGKKNMPDILDELLKAEAVTLTRSPRFHTSKAK